jgi:hypothetical protein
MVLRYAAASSFLCAGAHPPLHQQLAVWTMKCVGYDQQFQRDLVRQITGWVPPRPKGRTGKSTSKSKPQITAAKKAVSTRRKKPEPKRALTVESEDEG